MIHRFISTKQCIPNEFHPNVYEIDFESLYNQGYRLILTDLDNTLISYDEHLPNPQNVTLLKRLENIGFEVIIISNNHPSRVKSFLQELNKFLPLIGEFPQSFWEKASRKMKL